MAKNPHASLFCNFSEDLRVLNLLQALDAWVKAPRSQDWYPVPGILAAPGGLWFEGCYKEMRLGNLLFVTMMRMHKKLPALH